MEEMVTVNGVLVKLLMKKRIKFIYHLVIAETMRKKQWIVWVWDETTNVYFWGHYFNEKKDAVKDFEDRYSGKKGIV